MNLTLILEKNCDVLHEGMTYVLDIDFVDKYVLDIDLVDKYLH